MLTHEFSKTAGRRAFICKVSGSCKHLKSIGNGQELVWQSSVSRPFEIPGAYRNQQSKIGKTWSRLAKNLSKKPKWPNFVIQVLLKTGHLQAEKEGEIACFRVFRQILRECETFDGC